MAMASVQCTNFSHPILPAAGCAFEDGTIVRCDSGLIVKIVDGERRPYSWDVWVADGKPAWGKNSGEAACNKMNTCNGGSPMPYPCELQTTDTAAGGSACWAATCGFHAGGRLTLRDSASQAARVCGSHTLTPRD